MITVVDIAGRKTLPPCRSWAEKNGLTAQGEFEKNLKGRTKYNMSRSDCKEETRPLPPPFSSFNKSN